jgi:pimeloyl-ACP methyl ester carboxylesterase
MQAKIRLLASRMAMSCHFNQAARLAFFLSLLLTTLPAVLHAEDRFFDSAGVRIHYTVEGKGEPIILLHPFGLTAAGWKQIGVVQALSGDYQVIAIDARGHGQSEKPHDASAYGIKMVDDVIRLMDHLKIGKAHVVGYSMGGVVAEHLLASHSDRLLTATIGGVGWMDHEETARLGNQTADAVERGRSTLPAGNDLQALAALARSSYPPIPEERFRRVKIPTLALVGEGDPLRAGVDRLGAMIPGMKVVVIPGKTHINAPTDPLFLSSVKSFLAQYSIAHANTARAADSIDQLYSAIRANEQRD